MVRLVINADRSKSDENVALLATQIRAATEAHSQDALKRRLVEEEHRFGLGEERLAMVGRHLTEGESHIATLTRIIAEKRLAGEDTANTESSLEACLDLQRQFEDFRSLIYANNERRAL